MKVFVYGSLKKGFHNNCVLGDSEFVCTDIVTGYSLVDLGSFPMALPDPNGYIIGEVYYITPETLEALDRLESEGSFYKRELVDGDIEQNMFIYIGMRAQRAHNGFDFWNKGYK